MDAHDSRVHRKAAMPEPTDPAKPSNPSPDAGNKPAPAAAKPKRRRRWPYVILALVLVLLLLVLLAPKIASTAAARNYVVGRINQNLNGSVEIQDWSLSWTGGI